MVAATGIAISQQPNTPTATLLVNGVNGPPFPIVTTIETNVPAMGLIQGNPNAPFAILQSATGMIQAGSGTFFGDKLDLPLTPPPIVVASGFRSPGFQTNHVGQASAFSTYPQSALGSNVAHQVVLLDTSSPFGFSLTAATGATIVQGALTIPLTLGDEGMFNVNMAPLQLPFYGINYTNVHVSANGYMTFGAALSDFTPSDVEFNNGLPRIAAFWTDLDQSGAPGATVSATIDTTSSPTAPGFLRVNFTNVPDWTSLNPHTFSMQIWANGVIQINHAASNPASIFDQITGIGPGGGINPQPEKDLSAFLAPNSYAGAANESHYQWFGLVLFHPFYTQSNDPYDLSGKNVNFVPIGSGGLPLSADRYLLY
jgi:hypothetical protein